MIHDTVWLNLKIITLSESQTEKSPESTLCSVSITYSQPASACSVVSDSLQPHGL